MCLWCTATRYLQRPSLDWAKHYAVDARDIQLLQSAPLSGVSSPPLTFVKSGYVFPSVPGIGPRIDFSPENQLGIESLIELFQEGTSGLQRFTVNINISHTFPTPFSHLTPANTPDWTLLSTSADNVRVVYPLDVHMETYIETMDGVTDMWKVFNPALCEHHELPKLMILRDCAPGSEHCPAKLRHRYDIGAIDYRGNYDCSWQVWYIRQVGEIEEPLNSRRTRPS